MWTTWTAAAVWVLLAGAASAQQPTLHDDLLDRLVGRWILTGTIAGRETTHDVTAEWTLNHQFVAVHELSRERDADGRPAYQATAYVGWHEAKKLYVCYWLDVFGGGFAGAGYAEPRPNELPFVFGEAGEAFHNTFVFDPAARAWQWRMDNDHHGALEPFARVQLTRVADR
jgi:hypothetical protein